jgi:hypothetical protein
VSKVFISHSRGDRAAARVLADSLQRLPAVQVYLDDELTGGESWWAQILEHIRTCTVLVFTLSDASLHSKICQAQLAYAQALGLPILPVQVGDVPSYRIDPLFSTTIDFRNPDATSGMKLVAALQESVNQRDELPDPLPEPPPIPYEYLLIPYEYHLRLNTSLRAQEPLPPSAQDQVLFELRSALDEEHDRAVQEDVRYLLRQLRRRGDCTQRTARQIDEILDTDAWRGAPASAMPESAEASFQTAASDSAQPERRRESETKPTASSRGAKPPPAPRWRTNTENALEDVRRSTRARVTGTAPRKEKRTQVAHDDVDCSVFAPEAMSPGSRAMVQVFVHLPEQASLATRMARSLDPRTKRRGSCTLEVPITRGEHLTFELTMPGLDVPTPVKQLRWTGTKAFVQFEVVVPAELPIGPSILGTVTAWRHGIAIGTLMFTVQIEPGAAGTLYKILGDGAKRYSRAFISYASEDRAHVLARVQMLRIANIDYFQDIEMAPGERWEKELYRQIDRCDLFLLFWSQAAKQSKWVRRETQYALELGTKAPDVKPVPIEGPPVVSPWKELKAIHVNDALLAQLAVAARLS